MAGVTVTSPPSGYSTEKPFLGETKVVVGFGSAVGVERSSPTLVSTAIAPAINTNAAAAAVIQARRVDLSGEGAGTTCDLRLSVVAESRHDRLPGRWRRVCACSDLAQVAFETVRESTHPSSSFLSAASPRRRCERTVAAGISSIAAMSDAA